MIFPSFSLEEQSFDRGLYVRSKHSVGGMLMDRSQTCKDFVGMGGNVLEASDLRFRSGVGKRPT